MTDKINIEETKSFCFKNCMGTVVAVGQRDALPWTDVTLRTSYNKCHIWTSDWMSPINKCTGHRKYAFPDPCVMVFFSCCDMYYHLSQYWSLSFLATTNKCTELRKYAFPVMLRVGEWGSASFSNPFVASPTSQLILQPFRRFTYVTARSKPLPLLHLRHRHFTYVTWRAAHAMYSIQ